MRVLQLDHDNLSRLHIGTALEAKKIDVDQVEECEDAQHFSYIYDAAVVSKLEDVVALRRLDFDAPILLLSDKSDIRDRVAGLDAGADDYLVKPVHKAELLARLYAVVRRARGYTLSTIETHGMVVHLDESKVTFEGNRIPLTRREYQLVEMLVLAKGRVISKAHFIEHAYGHMDMPEEKIFDVYVCKIRRKLGALFGGKQPIETVWGLGYRWSEKLIEKSESGGWRDAA